MKDQLEPLPGISVHTLAIDLATENAAGRVRDFCAKAGFDVEVLVNCAGFLIHGEVLHAEPERIRSLIHLHTTTPTLLCRYFAESMIRRGKGYILNVSSIAAVMPFPTISLYGPSKTYLRTFTHALRTEMKPLGIHVTCLIPGATDTNLFDPELFNISMWKRLGFVKEPGSVASAGIKAVLANRPECIPGFLNKVIVLSVPLLPYFLINLTYRWKKRFRKRSPEPRESG